jgi:maleylpyruvate isomerase
VDTEISSSLARIQESTGQLLTSAGALTDARAAGPSRLPGWSRGHVLTHLARNADGFCNLLAWARTGVKTPMYPSEAARDADIAAGAGRSAAELTADLRDSSATFAAAAAGLTAADWAAQVARRGDTFPAREILSRRWSELEFHHVDLDAGYQAADWPAAWVAQELPQVAESFAGRPDMPPCQLYPDGWAGRLTVGPASPHTPGVAVRGAPWELLAWLSGRAAGSGLQVTGAAAVPVPPPLR